MPKSKAGQEKSRVRWEHVMISDPERGLRGWWGHVQRVGDSPQNEEDAGWDFGGDSRKREE